MKLKHWINLSLVAITGLALVSINSTVNASETNEVPQPQSDGKTYSSLNEGQRNVALTGHNNVYNRLHHRKVVFSKAKIKQLDPHNSATTNFRVYRRAILGKRIYYKVVSFDGKFRGWVYGGKDPLHYSGGLKFFQTYQPTKVSLDPNAKYQVKIVNGRKLDDYFYITPQNVMYNEKGYHIDNKILKDTFTLRQAWQRTREGDVWYNIDVNGGNSLIDRSWVRASDLTKVTSSDNDQNNVQANINDGVILKGKQIGFLGSSITRGRAAGGKSFVDDLQQQFGIIPNKQAVDGTPLAGTTSHTYFNRMKSLMPTSKHFDAFVTQLSTNDGSVFHKPLGTISGSTDLNSFDTNTTTGAIEYIAKYVQENYHCPLVFFTCLNQNNSQYGQLVDRLYQLQAKWHFSIIDFYNDTALNQTMYNPNSGNMADNVHLLNQDMKF